MIAMIGTSHWPCWLAEAGNILLLCTKYATASPVLLCTSTPTNLLQYVLLYTAADSSERNLQIGTVFASENYICPNAVGVDIGEALLTRQLLLQLRLQLYIHNN